MNHLGHGFHEGRHDISDMGAIEHFLKYGHVCRRCLLDQQLGVIRHDLKRNSTVSGHLGLAGSGDGVVVADDDHEPDTA